MINAAIQNKKEKIVLYRRSWALFASLSSLLVYALHCLFPLLQYVHSPFPSPTHLSSLHPSLSVLLAVGRGGWVADASCVGVGWLQNFEKIILNFVKFRKNFAKHEIKNFVKIMEIMKTKILQPPYVGEEWGSPGVSSALTQIVPYSSSLYTVFHSVIHSWASLIENLAAEDR